MKEVLCLRETFAPTPTQQVTHPPWGGNSRSNAETYLYALPISEKQHILPEDATRDHMQTLIWTLYQSVKSKTCTLRMQLEIKCRDLSVLSANQWKTTNPPWWCNSKSIRSASSEKQHIHPPHHRKYLRAADYLAWSFFKTCDWLVSSFLYPDWFRKGSG